MLIDENFIKNNLNKNSVQYLLSFTAQNFSMFLTTNDCDVVCKDICYKSGVVIKDISVGDMSNIEDIFIQILDNYNGNSICVEQLLQAKVNVKIYFTQQQNDADFTVFSGFVSKITEENDKLGILISSSMSRLKTQVGELFSPLCRACLGDSKCGVLLENFKAIGKILDIVSDDCFIGDHQFYKQTQTGYYRYGLIKFLTGKLSGIFLQVKDEEDGKVFLLKNTKLLSVGDEYEIFAGCDKTIKSCKEKFDNIKNFRGEPFIG